MSMPPDPFDQHTDTLKMAAFHLHRYLGQLREAHQMLGMDTDKVGQALVWSAMLNEHMNPYQGSRMQHGETVPPTTGT